MARKNKNQPVEVRIEIDGLDVTAVLNATEPMGSGAWRLVAVVLG